MIAPLVMLGGAALLDWAVFVGVVLGTMAADVAIFGIKAHRVSFRESTIRSAIWIIVSLLFSGFIYTRMGAEESVTYIVAYLVEKSLSVDNLFVFLVIFTYFRVREDHQQHVLFWGVGGAVVMRAIFILTGTALLNRFHWMMYVFGAFLVFTGAKLAFKKEDSVDPESNLALKLARRFLRTTDRPDGDRFTTTIDGVRYATPLLLVLIVIEFTDVLFAVDSVPAVLAISKNLFIVYTSNIFAVLGLRALYFMLAGMMSRFRYLDIGLAVILAFIGTKMLLTNVFKVPNLASLGVIAGVLAIAVIASLAHPPPEEEENGE